MMTLFPFPGAPTGRFKCAPPLREGENRQRLLQGLADGIIDSVGTDHSPSGSSLLRAKSASSWPQLCC